MDDILQKFEAKILDLIQEAKRLREANLHLQRAQAHLNRDKTLLSSKQQAAMSQIESIIARLKTLEDKL